MNEYHVIVRDSLLDNKGRLVWVYGQTGFGKTTILRQKELNWPNNSLWLDSESIEPLDQLKAFLPHNDEVSSALFIDDIHRFRDEFVDYFFVNLPKHCNIYISSRQFSPASNINLIVLNRFTVIDFHQLRLNLTQIDEVLTPHSVISSSDIYLMSLGWPVLINLLSAKLPLARDINHLKNLVNRPPNVLANYAGSHLIALAKGFQRQFLGWCAIVDTLSKSLFSVVERGALDDYCEHELNGLTVYHDDAWQLLPLLKHACWIHFSRDDQDGLHALYESLVQRCLEHGDIQLAIKLLLDIGEKDKAIACLSKMGGLLEWISHGQTNLIAVYQLFEQQDIDDNESLAWLACAVHYKSGNVAKARKIINKHGHKDSNNTLVWMVADSLVKLHEGRLFESNNYDKLEAFSKSTANAAPFARAIIYNLMGITLLQAGNNERGHDALVLAKTFYQELSEAQYSMAFMKVHLSHSMVLGAQLDSAKALLNRTNADIQLHFNQDKSIRLSLQIVKLEVNFLSGLSTALRSVDQLIKRLSHSESWFDLFATLYPIAIKLSVQQNNLTYLPRWFSTAATYFQTNPIEYADVLLSQLAKLLIVKFPKLNRTLASYLIDDSKIDIQQLPWRIQSIIVDVMFEENQWDLDLVTSMFEQSKLNNNQLLATQCKVMLVIGKQQSMLPDVLIEEVSGQGLIALLWQVQAFIPKQKLAMLIRESNRQSLFTISEPTVLDKQSGLSPKELQVHKLLCASMRNKEIALKMDISEQTVKFHLKNIYRKLNVKSRKEAITKLA